MSAVAQAIESPAEAVELTEEQLREALSRAHSTMLAQTLQITDLRQTVTALSATLGNLCRLTLAGDTQAAAEELARLSVRYRAINSAIMSRKVH